MSRTEYRCRLAIEADNHSAALINFLKMKKVRNFSEKDKLLSAISAYWLPFALKEDGSYSDEELMHCARSAIYKLTLHINYLAETFGIEANDVSVLPSSSPRKTNFPIKSGLMTDSANPEPFINHQDDSAFETMFG